MRKFMKIDIVGGGISGFTSAISLKEQNKNLNVNIYEKNKEIGYNYEGRKCGEAHTVEKEWSRFSIHSNPSLHYSIIPTLQGLAKLTDSREGEAYGFQPAGRGSKTQRRGPRLGGECPESHVHAFGGGRENP